MTIAILCAVCYNEFVKRLTRFDNIYNFFCRIFDFIGGIDYDEIHITKRFVLWQRSY